jgi:hypothetical protein
VIAVVSGALIGWTVANVPLESLTVGDWLRSLAWAGAAVMAPIVGAAASATGARMPSFAQTAPPHPHDVVAWSLGVV